jgi:2-oxoglutarate dehydrogenase E1 component
MLRNAAPLARRAAPALLRREHPRAWPCRGARAFYDDAAASGPNALYIESVYAQWKIDPTKLDPRWDTYFKKVESGEDAGGLPVPTGAARDAALKSRQDAGAAPGRAGRSVARVAGTNVDSVVDPVALKYFIAAFQNRGHEAANLDPLGMNQWRSWNRSPDVPELTPQFHGFTEELMGEKVSGNNQLWKGSTGGNQGFLGGMGALGESEMTLGDLVQRVKATYCGTLGVEYMHILDTTKLNWIRNKIETPDFLIIGKEKSLKTYERMCYADGFERFLGDKFKTTKRFGIDGGESVIPGLQAMVDRAVELGCEEFVFGMPHRGRLNVLVNVLGKPMPQMLAEFMGTAYDVDKVLSELEAEDWSSAGDVKYHLGTSHVRTYPDMGTVTLTLEANPSHLETVAPVTLGRTRAKQYYGGDTEEMKRAVMPIIMHGDASFAGQGVVYETMQLAAVDDFDVGGTIHVIVNNQVGFTTDPRNSRSTAYCSDLGKGFNCPIFHCNGDDPVAVVRAFEMAAEWRQEWGTDVILDIVCYRRFGHNESDNPDFTQPLLYKAISKQRRSEELLAESLVKQGHATVADIEAIKNKVWNKFEADYKAAQNYDPMAKGDWVATKWEGLRGPNEIAQAKTSGVDLDLLKAIGIKLCEVPADFKLHNSLKRIMKGKRERVEAGDGLDWGTCEGLAFGSLLLEGNHVRLTGQDVQRGTFSHRHCVVHDQATDTEHNFLNELNMGPQETFIARNSILAEYAVLGFELGYSYENPNALVIWEAQFGDFANTAQVMIDQFICAGEHKWLQQSALTMLLPHGYDGQGAEHSSCRLERYLQLCDDDEDNVPDYEAYEEAETGTQIQKANWQVMNLSTPANYFHALRCQMKRDFRKPLVVAAPKALLRHKACVSSLEDMGPNSKFQRVIPERDPAIAGKPEQVDRLVFCTGKIYYELLAERERLGLTNVALVTVEMIAPFPFDKVRDQIKLYENVDRGDGIHPGNIIWCQEEPKNMGAWFYVRPRAVCVAREALDLDLVVRYVGRRASAAPATGIGKLHSAEQAALIQEAVVGRASGGEGNVDRPTALLGHQT